MRMFMEVMVLQMALNLYLSMGHLRLASAASPPSAISPLSKIPSLLTEVWPTSLPPELVSPLPLASYVTLPVLLPFQFPQFVKRECS